MLACNYNYIVRGFDDFGQMAGIDFDLELKGVPLGGDRPTDVDLLSDEDYQLKAVGTGSYHPHLAFDVIVEAREKHALWSDWTHHLSFAHRVLQPVKIGWWFVS